MLLYLNYLRPDLANVVRELPKCMDGASLAAYKEMQRVTTFVLDTKLHCIGQEILNTVSALAIGQEILNTGSVSLDSSCICLESNLLEIQGSEGCYVVKQ
jgi:hypothetical protein